MSKERLKRLATLESKLLRPAFKSFPGAAVAAELRWILTRHDAVKAGKAYLVPRTYEPTPDTPAAPAVHRQLDVIHDRLIAGEREAKAARRAEKLKRRAARRRAAALDKPAPAPNWAAAGKPTSASRDGSRAAASGFQRTARFAV
jgi:hypothetical protein